MDAIEKTNRSRPDNLNSKPAVPIARAMIKEYLEKLGFFTTNIAAPDSEKLLVYHNQAARRTAADYLACLERIRNRSLPLPLLSVNNNLYVEVLRNAAAISDELVGAVLEFLDPESVTVHEIDLIKLDGGKLWEAITKGNVSFDPSQIPDPSRFPVVFCRTGTSPSGFEVLSALVEDVEVFDGVPVRVPVLCYAPKYESVEDFFGSTSSTHDLIHLMQRVCRKERSDEPLYVLKNDEMVLADGVADAATGIKDELEVALLMPRIFPDYNKDKISDSAVNSIRKIRDHCVQNRSASPRAILDRIDLSAYKLPKSTSDKVRRLLSG